MRRRAGPSSSLCRIVVPLLLAVTLLVSCATTGKYQRVLQSWMGADVNGLIQAWGPPSNQYAMPNGHVMYTWLWVGGTLVTVRYNQYWNMVTAGSVTYWCKTTFTASPSGILHSWRWEGNACRSS